MLEKSQPHAGAEGNVLGGAAEKTLCKAGKWSLRTGQLQKQTARGVRWGKVRQPGGLPGTLALPPAPPAPTESALYLGRGAIFCLPARVPQLTVRKAPSLLLHLLCGSPHTPLAQPNPGEHASSPWLGAKPRKTEQVQASKGEKVQRPHTGHPEFQCEAQLLRHLGAHRLPAFQKELFPTPSLES